MKRKSGILAFALILSILLTSCGSENQTSTAESDEAGYAISGSTSSVGIDSAEGESQFGGWDTSDAEIEESSTVDSNSVYENQNAKLIREANLNLETTQFDTAVSALNQLVRSLNGYYETSQVDSGTYYSSNYNRYGNYTVRIPADGYDAFLAQAGDLAHISNISESTRDVGDEYYDAELHLQTLQVKQERLLALMEKAELMEDIISLESALSDVEYEIQQYSSTLTRYDALVDYATFNVTLEEVSSITTETAETAPLNERIGSAFSNAISNFTDGVSNFVVWICYHFIGILIFAAIAAGGLIIGSKFYHKRKQNQKSNTGTT